MKKELGLNQKRWVEELRSGKWKQGTTWLCKSDSYCCLGVGCEVFGVQSSQEGDTKHYGAGGWGTTAPLELVDLLALRTDDGEGRDGRCLASLNDKGSTFLEIANLLEQNPGNWFTESK